MYQASTFACYVNFFVYKKDVCECITMVYPGVMVDHREPKVRRADAIRSALEELIFSGEFSDGDRLDEVKLAERFQVSRTPLREAFQALAEAGLLELIPRRGAFVRHPSFVELVEMFEVMAELEAMCGRLAARRITDRSLQELETAARACERAMEQGDTDEYYWENERFHSLLYDASGNTFLAAEAKKLHRRLQTFRRMQLLVRGRMPQSMAEHRAILAALQHGDAPKAEIALRAHVSVQGEKFNDLMANYGHAAMKRAG